MSALDDPLPTLRPELRLLPAAAGVSGEPTWIIHDPIRNAYIQIDDQTYAVLSKWGNRKTVKELEQSFVDEVKYEVTREQISKFIDFVRHNQLTSENSPETWQRFSKLHANSKSSLVTKIVHGYLFFRVPLVQPQRFLEKTLPLADICAGSARG